jgi:hypothetical protein
MLFAQQPSELATSFPTNAQLIETARVAGVASQSLSDCINGGKYTSMVRGLAQATGISGTPTIRINGGDFSFNEDTTTPQDLISKVTQITGPVPGLAGSPPSASPPGKPGPAPGAPPASPAPSASPPGSPGPAPGYVSPPPAPVSPAPPTPSPVAP